jgi:Domain of unknown function (DUF4386)
MGESVQKAEQRLLHGQARFAGLIYAVVVMTGIFSLSYAPKRVFAGEAPLEIVQGVVANESLFRASTAAEVACYAAFLVLGLAFFQLLSRAGQFAAALMAALVIASVPLAFANLAHHFEILRAIEGGASQTAADLVTAAGARYDDGLFLLKIFWGAWLIPLGYLVFRSGFLPRILGVLLVLGGVGYLADFFGQLLFYGYGESGLARYFRAPRIAEILICLWLLIFGARRSFLPERRNS